MTEPADAGMEGINIERVTQWVADRIEGLEPPLTFTLIAGGHSNLTYKFTDQKGAAYVLRRPPLGHILESAHDMGREHRIISALAPTQVPVPATFGLCEDKGVNGQPFYLMSFVEGVVPHDAEAAAPIPAPERRSAGEHIIEVLATLHLVNPDDIGLGNLARKEAYLQRQLKRWTRQWEATKTHEIPEMEESARLLHEDMPEQVGSAIGPRRLSHRQHDDPRWAHGGAARLGAVYARRPAGRPWAICSTTGRSRASQARDANATGIGGFPYRDYPLRRL